jgi:hypothetical protein
LKEPSWGKICNKFLHIIFINDVPAEREFLVWIVDPKTSVECPVWKIFNLLSSDMVYMAEGIMG